MGEDSGTTASDPRIEAVLAALRLERASVVCLGEAWDEAARAAYGGRVRAELFSAYGVPAPARLDRVIAEAAVMRLPSARCVEVIGEAFGLQPLPERRY